MKYIFVSGGVISGLGKGVTVASLALLLKSRGYRVTTFKCDMYLNIDAGTMNPLEHGEVFVTHDGLETDQDLGHYERFLGQSLTRQNYTTNGQVYKQVLENERALAYDGICVQPYYHIPPEIIKRWDEAARVHNAEIILIEMGGTAGEYEGLLFFEAARRLKFKRPNDVCFVHVGYLPVPGSIGEPKSKPIQQSVSYLHGMGIQPDMIICRAEKDIDQKRKDKIALATNVPIENIFSSPDINSVYRVPIILEKQKLPQKVLKSLNLPFKKANLAPWEKMLNKLNKAKNEKTIAIIGKYQKTGDYTLEDAYVCVVEALKHAGCTLGIKPKILWIDSEGLEKKTEKEIEETLSGICGIIVPQGWGSRGVEGKIKAVKYARENKIPYLGLCFGMQMAVIEFARNVLKLKGANSEEVNHTTAHPAIHIIPNQKKYLLEKQYGGTIRLGAWPCKLKKGTVLEQIYLRYKDATKAPWKQTRNLEIVSGKPNLIFERHRHRYEFNLKYKKSFEKSGLVVSGISLDDKLVEAVELKNHPFFVGTQFHPEYLSRPLMPHPIFCAFLKTCLKA